VNGDDTKKRAAPVAAPEGQRKGARDRVAAARVFESGANAPFTGVEIDALVAGLERFGEEKSHWENIRTHYPCFKASERSTVDLKDKWRNMCVAADRPAGFKFRIAHFTPELLDKVRSVLAKMKKAEAAKPKKEKKVKKEKVVEVEVVEVEKVEKVKPIKKPIVQKKPEKTKKAKVETPVRKSLTAEERLEEVSKAQQALEEDDLMDEIDDEAIMA